LFGGASGAQSKSRSVAALPAKIVYVNVGQGDAVVMRVGGKVIVSDTGQYRYDVLDDALRDGLKAKRIDVLILGHAHDDHSKNAAELLQEGPLPALEEHLDSGREKRGGRRGASLSTSTSW